MAHLLIIDPQNDFMDLPGATLPVKGAMDDMQRLSRFIKNTSVDGIMVSLDSHSPYDIGHACFWMTKDGQQPAPFTNVMSDDVESDRIYPINEGLRKNVISYLNTLQASGKYQHTIWPNHCIPGTWGHQIQADLLLQINEWSLGQKIVDYIFKGTNPYSESYSAFEAEVPNEDPSTHTNMHMILKLKQAGRVFVAGEALSHCVKSSVETLLNYLAPKQIVLLEDCMSSVAGFESQGQEFLEDMRMLGVEVAKSTDFYSRKTQKCPS